MEKPEKPTYKVGDRVEKLCVTCGEERGHVVASVTKRGLISRVNCPKCGKLSSFKSGAKLTGGRSNADAGRALRANAHLSYRANDPASELRSG